MTNGQLILRSVYLGVVAGAIILGVAGKLVMATIALFANVDVNLSLRGLLEVTFVGAILGGLGGLLFVPLQFVLAERKMAADVLVGIFLFLGSLLFSTLVQPASAEAGLLRLLTLGMAALLCLIFGLTLSRFAQRRTT